MFELAGKRVWVAGHRGMVGSALTRALAQATSCTVLTVDRRELDLRSQQAVHDWLARQKPDMVFLAAARVGGIQANNSRPAEFLYENLMIEANIIHGSYTVGVDKLLFLGSSCIYPKFAPQPIQEEALLTGPLEPTNEWYAIAKIAGIKLVQAYRRQHGVNFVSAMPTNLYGPGDNFDLHSSHVLPALMRKIHEAKVTGRPTVSIWGTGRPLREFMHVDDLASACIFLAASYDDDEHINVGSGMEVSIADLARMIAEVIGYNGAFVFDASKPDGTPRKLLDSSRLQGLGWLPKVDLLEGINRTYQWYLANQHVLRAA